MSSPQPAEHEGITAGWTDLRRYFLEERIRQVTVSPGAGGPLARAILDNVGDGGTLSLVIGDRHLVVLEGWVPVSRVGRDPAAR
jgi:hypothetical protein